jgi:hypothetical protein
MLKEEVVKLLLDQETIPKLTKEVETLRVVPLEEELPTEEIIAVVILAVLEEAFAVDLEVAMKVLLVLAAVKAVA